MVKPIFIGSLGLGIAYLVYHVYQIADANDIFFRLVVTILAGLYIGLLFLLYVLPLISDGLTRLMYSEPSGGAEIDDPLHDYRSLVAQGNYQGGLEALRVVVMDDASNRMAWVEMAKVQVSHLDDPEGAVETLSEALAGREWELDDAAFFMFRISEIQLESLQNQQAAVSVLKQVCELMPESRHSANATHQLRELGAL